MTDEAKALVELQRAAGLKDLPTPLTHDLRIAVSGKGPRAYDWQDKPHRLLYDACAEIETQAREIERLRGALEQIAQADYGYTDIIESGAPPEKHADYFCSMVTWRQRTARAALEGDSHDQ